MDTKHGGERRFSIEIHGSYNDLTECAEAERAEGMEDLDTEIFHRDVIRACLLLVGIIILLVILGLVIYFIVRAKDEK